jgi:DNA-binding NarL/FixJ family response regulator
MIRVYIAEDHAIVRRGLRQILESSGAFEVVGEATTGREVLNATNKETWDVLLLDLSMPFVSGGEVLKRVLAERPTLAVVILSMYPADQYAERLLTDGARAYLSKDCSPEDVIAAVERAVRGDAYIVPSQDPRHRTRSSERPHLTLTSREHQVFTLIVQGESVTEIAAELNLHVSTVSNHLTTIKNKLGVRSVADIVHYAHRIKLFG